jgi:hypothetical protein
MQAGAANRSHQVDWHSRLTDPSGSYAGGPIPAWCRVSACRAANWSFPVACRFGAADRRQPELLITEELQCLSLRAVSTCRRSSGRLRDRVTRPCSHQRDSTALKLRNGGRNRKLAPCDSDRAAKLTHMRPRRSKITTGNGRGKASVAFRGGTYRPAALRHGEPVGEVIDAPCPQTNEVAALYLLHASEGVLPFPEEGFPKCTFCTIAHPLPGPRR